jgi:hypothetical protein
MGHIGLPDQAICGVAEELTPWLRTRDVKSPNDVYVGHVWLPSGARRSQAFVKVFPLGNRNQSVYNEVIGHHLAVQCGLPSPLTFPCACHRSLLRSGSSAVMAPDSNSPFVLGIASVDGNAKALPQTARASGAIWADIMNWPYVAHSAVFDELVGNDDRHIENLIRCGPHNYTLIDNERILFGEPWFNLDLSELRNRRCEPNVLADTIAEGTDELVRRRMMDVAQRMITETVLTAPEIAQRMEQMCSAPAGITDYLIEMLNSRRLILKVLLQWHMQKGDLFRASTNR